MRLIDADALDIDSFPIGDDEDECVVVYTNIKNAPIIDAIPVEWLENSLKNSMDAQWHYAVRSVLHEWQEWQKEQEAR